MKPTVDETFINKYADMVTDNVCTANNVDPMNRTTRAILAWNLLNPDNKLTPNGLTYDKGDERGFYVCDDGNVVDAERNTLIMDAVSACLHPAAFRNILFYQPTDIRVERPAKVYEATMMFSTNTLSLHSIADHMVYAANSLRSRTLMSWMPLLKAFTTHSYVGLNLTFTDTKGSTYQIAPKECGVSDNVMFVSDENVIFESGKSISVKMDMIDNDYRYKSPHVYWETK